MNWNFWNPFGGSTTSQSGGVVAPRNLQTFPGQIVFGGTPSFSTTATSWPAYAPTHEHLLEQLYAKLLSEKKFAEWVREKMKREGRPRGYFAAVPGCACAWCQLSELERQVAIAKASEP